jgi:hypothetical protein
MDEETLARLIFEYFASNKDAPYSFNADGEDLTVGVDGYLDCRHIAAAILERRT